MQIPKTVIVMGRSGSGKGTQINLLKESYDSDNIFHFEPGNIFRELSALESYSSKKIKEITERGELVPDFITNGLFVESLLSNIQSGEQLLIFDGYPRSINQAGILDQMLNFYGRKSAVVLHVKVSEQEVRNRLSARGRGDDIDENALNTRIRFYNQSVLPTISWYENQSHYSVITVDGEGSIEEIQKNIITQLSEIKN